MHTYLLKELSLFFGQKPTKAAMQANRNNTQEIFKNFAPFTDCITEIMQKILMLLCQCIIY